VFNLQFSCILFDTAPAGPKKFRPHGTVTPPFVALLALVLLVGCEAERFTESFRPGSPLLCGFESYAQRKEMNDFLTLGISPKKAIGIVWQHLDN